MKTLISLSQKAAALAVVLLTSLTLSVEADEIRLTIESFNPGAKSLFPVSSTLIYGPTEAVLLDAQFQRNDAEEVLKMIKKSGKDLKAIYISHGDPDFYFGLDVLTAAYPKAQILASAETLKHIKATVKKKVAYWGPILKENAPQKTVMPNLLEGDSLTVDGKVLEIVGLQGHDPKHSFVWIPSEKTIAGGVVLYEGVHVWMADTQSPESRDNWRKTLSVMEGLKAERIIPGHVIGQSRENTDAISFTRSYLAVFEEEAVKASTSTELVKAMRNRYPDFTNIQDLDLSAKVIKGEMQWP